MPFYTDLPRPKKIMLVASSVVLVLCIVWILSFIVPAAFGPGEIKTPDTPAHREASSTNLAIAELGLLDVGASVASEEPIRLKVRGMVHSKAEYDRLVAMLRETRPNEDYDIQVEIGP